MGKKSKPPPAPDYKALAEQTAASNAAATKAQTEANRPDQIDAYGNRLTWSQDPSGKWTQQVSLSDQNQQALDQQNALRSQLMGQMSGMVGKPVDMSGLQGYSNYDQSQLQGVDPNALNGGAMGQLGDAGQMGQLQGGYGDVGKLQENYGQMGQLQGAGLFNMDAAGNSKAIQDATYGLLAPQREMARNAEIQRLKNQGLTEDSPAFQRAIARLDTGDTQAQLQALLAGQQEYGNQYQRALQANQSNFGQNLNAAQFANQSQNQLFGQDIQRSQLASQNQNQLFNQDLAQAQFGSQNQNQRWNQMLQGAQFGDQQNQQRFNQQLQQQQLALALRGQQFDEQGQQAALNQAIRAQQLGEMDYQRSQPMSELAQLMQMQSYSNPQFGSFVSAGNAGGVDYSGAAQNQYNAAVGATNAANQGKANTTSGIVSIGSAALMAF